MSSEYRLLASQYVLHVDGSPVGRPTAMLSLAFDRKSGTLYKHGDPAMVQTWARVTLPRLAAKACTQQADNLVVVTGRLPIHEVNMCLVETTHGARFYERLMAGHFETARVA